MLEFVASKSVLMIAMVVLVAVISSVFSVQRDAMRAGELQDIADELADALQDMARSNAEGTRKVSFDVDGSGPGMVLPDKVDGRPYSIEVHPDQVIIGQDGTFGTSGFAGRVHPCDPQAIGTGPGGTTAEELARLDSEEGPLSVTSGHGFVITNRAMRVDGWEAVVTFVHEA